MNTKIQLKVKLKVPYACTGHAMLNMWTGKSLLWTKTCDEMCEYVCVCVCVCVCVWACVHVCVCITTVQPHQHTYMHKVQHNNIAKSIPAWTKSTTCMHRSGHVVMWTGKNLLWMKICACVRVCVCVCVCACIVCMCRRNMTLWLYNYYFWGFNVYIFVNHCQCCMAL